MTEPELRDRNGFAVPSSSVFDALRQFEETYRPRVERRQARWDAYTREHGKTPSAFADKSRRLKKLCRKGVAKDLRGAVWAGVSGAATQQSASRGLFHKLSQDAEAAAASQLLPAADQIEMDLHRTFPEHPRFSRFTEEGGRGMNQLRRVLLAYSLRNQSVGYCQGMNFICAYLLLHMDEESAFWCLSRVIEVLMPPDYYTDTMSGCHADQQVFQALIRKRFPRMFAHMERIGMIVELACMQWFLCLFSRTFPSETVLRCWDSFFFEGTKVLFRVALAVLHIHEEELFKCHDAHEFSMKLQDIATNLVDCERVMKTSFKIRKFRSATVSKLRAVHMAPILKEQSEQAERRAQREAERQMSVQRSAAELAAAAPPAALEPTAVAKPAAADDAAAAVPTRPRGTSEPPRPNLQRASSISTFSEDTTTTATSTPSGTPRTSLEGEREPRASKGRRWSHAGEKPPARQWSTRKEADPAGGGFTSTTSPVPEEPEWGFQDK
mmetsp:Transcript_67392/g.158952  ORF Transcript_67392/g.158952 Transcript_67392/m.158952 type:complete len:496 (+) Transcript_67392:26-1513(+)